MAYAIAAGVGIGVVDSLQCITTMLTYQYAGVEFEKRAYNPKTDSQILLKIPTKIGEIVLDGYLGIRKRILGDPEDPDFCPEKLSSFKFKTARAVDAIVLESAPTILEEITFRGVLQPLGAKVLAVALPSLRSRVAVGIPLPNLISLIATGCLFGYAHAADYTKGGFFAAANIATAGCLYGIAKERFGIVSAIIAHATSNLLGRYIHRTIENRYEKEKQKQSLEWNKSFIECLKKKEVTFNLPMWNGANLTSDITADFYFIAKSLDPLPKETKEKIAEEKLSFEEIRELVMQHGYTTDEEIATKLIDLYTQENVQIEENLRD